MRSGLPGRTRFTATALAVAGGLLGVFAAHVYNGRPGQYTAQATLGMLPGPEVQVAETPAFWAVLNDGQATRTAAMVIGDKRWLLAAASAAGVPTSSLTLTAGAVPQTTLITVKVDAASATSAESALDAVLADAVGFAATVSGPFELRTVAAPAARPKRPSDAQVFGALGGAGMLLGVGAGMWISRSARRRADASDGAAYPSAAGADREPAER